MKRMLPIALTVALVAALAAPAAANARAQQPGSLQGIARGAQQQPLPNATVQLRNVATGQLAGTGTTNAAGQFTFAGLNPGNYVVEVLDSAGKIIGTSTPVTVAAGTVATVTVTASAAAGAAATGAGGLFGWGTTGTIIGVAGAAAAVGVTAMVVTKDNKIVICHKPAGAVPQTITISESAKDSHLAHGDTLGACPVSPAR